MSRPTIAQIDLAALEYNLKLVRKMVGDKVKLLCVVKAHAYGHGIKEVSRKLVSCGVDYLGVATTDEAITLRDYLGPGVAILVLGSIFKEEADDIVKCNIIQTIVDRDIAMALSRSAKRFKKIVKAHIKIDTGMGRIGVWHQDAIDFIKCVKGLSGIEVEGIWTHLSSADEDESFTNEQIYIFRELVKELEALGIHIPLRHVANSMAVIGFNDSHLNLVRPGLVLYGLYPKCELKGKIDFMPVMTIKTKVVFLKEVPCGRHISYGKRFTTQRLTKIATLPIGYGDGYLRVLSNKASVLIRGQRAPVVGTVCMDQIMVDVGHIPQVSVSDEVVLLGRQGNEQISAEELAGLAGTIPYEIVCSIAPRVPRVYIDREQSAENRVQKNEKDYTYAEKI
jgi:alanine racemase